MIRFLHAADIHLDSPLRGLEQYTGAPIDEIRSATRRALENLVRLAIEEQVDFVVVAGDIYDGDWKDHNTGLFFVQQLVALHNEGISLYAISGNHDAANKMTRSLRLPSNPDGTAVTLSHTTPETILLEKLGVAIHGRGFDKEKVTENIVDSYPQAVSGMFNIGMLHTSLDGESEKEHARYAPCKVADLVAKQYDYWALGHIHLRAVRQDQPHIVYSGNIQGRHIREVGAKGCFLVSVDEHHNVDCQFQSLDVMRWEICRVDINGAEQPEELLDAFAEQLTKLLDEHDDMPLAIRVIVEGKCAAHRQLVADASQWSNELRSVAIANSSSRVWIEKIKWQTQADHDLDSLALSDGPIGELVEYIAQLRKQPDELSGLADSWNDLRRKLPDEVKRGDDSVAIDDATYVRELLDAVEPLLISRLLEEDSS